MKIILFQGWAWLQIIARQSASWQLTIRLKSPPKRGGSHLCEVYINGNYSICVHSTTRWCCDAPIFRNMHSYTRQIYMHIVSPKRLWITLHHQNLILYGHIFRAHPRVETTPIVIIECPFWVNTLRIVNIFACMSLQSVHTKFIVYSHVHSIFSNYYGHQECQSFSDYHSIHQRLTPHPGANLSIDMPCAMKFLSPGPFMLVGSEQHPAFMDCKTPPKV